MVDCTKMVMQAKKHNAIGTTFSARNKNLIDDQLDIASVFHNGSEHLKNVQITNDCIIVEKILMGTQSISLAERSHVSPVEIKDNIDFDYIIEKNVADNAMLLDANNGVFLSEPLDNSNGNDSTNNDKLNNDNKTMDQRMRELKC